MSADIESYIKNSNYANNISKSLEYMQYVFLEDDFENSFKFEDIADEDLEDAEINNHPITNNIFLNVHNLNHDNNKIIDKEERCIINLINPPNAYRELSIVFGYNNIKQILKGKIEYQTLINKLKYRGKHKIPLDVNELKRVVYKYINTVKDLNQRPFSYFDEDVVSSFINYYKDGSINSIVSYYIKKAQAKNKNNSKLDNIIFTFNVDTFRTIHFGITPDNFNFNPHDDREIFILDYIRMYWELYMLLVFTHICNISQEDEEAYFIKFYKVITLAVFTGMKMFLQLELNRSYGEFYEELKGFKTKDNKYLSDSGTKERQQITFKIKNSDFLTEAYKQEYQGAICNDKRIGEVKNDKHIDILLTIMRGSNDNKALFELTISGQYPLGRIYSSDTNPEVNINLNNMYAYGLLVMQPIIYLFRTCLNYSKDLEIKSYYTELQTHLEKYKGIKTHGLVPKLLSVILLAIHKRPNEEELTTILNKYFKTTDKAQKAEFRKLYKDIETSLAKKKDRLIDKMREELWRIVW